MKTILFDDPFLKKGYDPTLEDIYDTEKHNTYIEILQNNEHIPEYLQPIVRDIKKKYASYKSQDKKKKRYDEEQHITYNELIHKLYASSLQCYYCKDSVCLIYKNKNEQKQWSLERFDNNLGHYGSNTCISCLRCNLQRRNENHEYFKFGKQLCISKLD
tara:strand:+ start:8354 stop:8830 length:477 start_codon:yes stop_codon:yes gene_type:complete